MADFEEHAGQKIKNDVRIVIVGAGVAGIAAAQTLAKAGFRNVTILEAMNRIGGRVYTCDIGERKFSLYQTPISTNVARTGRGYLELGAQYLHDTSCQLYMTAVDEEIITADSMKEGGPVISEI